MDKVNKNDLKEKEERIIKDYGRVGKEILEIIKNKSKEKKGENIRDDER